jgi:hypothetical protein
MGKLIFGDKKALVFPDLLKSPDYGRKKLKEGWRNRSPADPRE